MLDSQILHTNYDEVQESSKQEKNKAKKRSVALRLISVQLESLQWTLRCIWSSDLHRSFERQHLSVGNKGQCSARSAHYIAKTITCCCIYELQFNAIRGIWKREKVLGVPSSCFINVTFDGQTGSIFYDSILQYCALRKHLFSKANKW